MFTILKQNPVIGIKIWPVSLYVKFNKLSGHDKLLEIRLLEKTARHKNINCLTPFEQMSLFLSTARIQLIFGDQLDSSNFTFRQKNINCSNCNWSTKVLENVNCSTQFIVKEMVRIE